MDFSFVSKTLCIWFLSVVHVITGRRKTEKKSSLRRAPLALRLSNTHLFGLVSPHVFR